MDLLTLSTPIEIMDVGAAAIAEVPIYKSLIDKGLGHLNAFDGDPRHTEGIRAAYGDATSIYTDFVFDGSQQTLYVADAASGMTSLLKPRQAALSFFNNFGGFGTPQSTEAVQTCTLDSVDGLPDIDLLKMDVQGAELTVMKHGQYKLRQCVAVQLEVSYVCLYDDQPTFGDVDVWMRSQGYAPHCFLDVKRWSITPTTFGGDPRVPGNQLLESDIVYVRDPLQLDRLSDEQLKKLAAVAQHCLRSYDLAAFVVLELQRRGALGPDTYKAYLDTCVAS